MNRAMPEKTFRSELREWRGKRLQKEAADILKVSVRTYQGWESGAHEPSTEKCLACVRAMMYQQEVRANE